MATVGSQSASTAYASKPNIAYPGTTASAARVATKAAQRITDDPSNVVPGTQVVATDRDAGVSETVRAEPLA